MLFLHSSVAHFLLWLGAFENFPPPVLPCDLRPRVPIRSHPTETLQYQAPTHSIAPCQTQMYHSNSDTLALPPSNATDSLPLLTAFCIPSFSLLTVAATLAKRPSQVKGALQSRLCSMHQEQARAKQYQLSEARLNSCSRALQGTALCWGQGR